MPETMSAFGLRAMQNSPYTKALALVIILAGTAAVVYAADADGDSAASTEATTQSGENDSTSKAADSSDKDEVFRPTEDISEDLAVPFPVDI